MKSADTTASGKIAIIGMASRFPAAQDAEGLWKAISEKRDCLADFSGGRTRELDHFYALAGTPEGPPTRRGGFLADFDKFDAQFFQIAPREAEWMDPQQRLLLEVAWEALEAAGQTLEALNGSNTGVFMGIWTNDYDLHAKLNAPAVDFFSLTGGPLYAAAGRIAHQFDLRGPDVSVNAASAASLVAIHLAVRSLRSGESSMALAGGVNMIFRDEQSRAFLRAGMLAEDGSCKFGAAGTDGIVRSEGAAVLVLKNLSDAQRDGDPVLGLILGTAVTNSGKSGGSLTTPSESAQRTTMLDALADAGVEPASVDYVEAHGTGSRAGDPVELAAIASVFGGPNRVSPCRVGSVKSNIGHTESAAGVAGVVKMVQALRHRTFPPTLYAERPNPTIDWASSGVVLESEGAPWSSPKNSPKDSPRRAAVNGLGLMGTNAHVVLEEAPGAARRELPARTQYLLPISASSHAALRQRAQHMLAWLDFLDREAETQLTDICYTAAVRRSHLSHRIVVAGRNATEIRDRLRDHLSGTQPTEPPIEKSLRFNDLELGTGLMPGTSLDSFCRLYASGSVLDWRQLYPVGNLVSLPSYPWQRERFWIESRLTEPFSTEARGTPPLSAVPSNLRDTNESFRGASTNSFAKDLTATAPGKRRDALTSWLREQVAVVLQSPIERIAPDKALKSLGLDSLMSMELLSRIERALGITLSSSTTWNYPEIFTLAQHLSERIAPGEEAGRPASGTNVANPEPSRSTKPSAAELLERELAGAEMILRGQAP
jgi:acyl transferase domain-containing protein